MSGADSGPMPPSAERGMAGSKFITEELGTINHLIPVLVQHRYIFKDLVVWKGLCFGKLSGSRRLLLEYLFHCS
jgi:hypothetical protein